jgi:lysylphosphatidylglycerol synthetase-like protein (DUF2156 family)
MGQLLGCILFILGASSVAQSIGRKLRGRQIRFVNLIVLVCGIVLSLFVFIIYINISNLSELNYFKDKEGLRYNPPIRRIMKFVQ